MIRSFARYVHNRRMLALVHPCNLKCASIAPRNEEMISPCG